MMVFTAAPGLPSIDKNRDAVLWIAVIKSGAHKVSKHTIQSSEWRNGCGLADETEQERFAFYFQY